MKKDETVTDNLPIRIFVNKIGNRITFKIKSALSGLRQFLATESPLKMTKYFTSKAPFVLKIFKFLS